MRDTVKKTYRLASAAWVYTPNVVRWAIAGYWHEPDRETIMNVLRGWDLPDHAIEALLTKKVPYTVEEGDVVVFTA